MSINKLIKTANKSTHKFRHASLILSGGRILSASCNTATVHAEINAMKKVGEKANLISATMINIRIRKDGTIGLSKPCLICRNAMKMFMIRKVIYSDNNGNFVTEKV